MPISAGWHSRGYLPHLKVPGAMYFVTFRLADSLPREVVLRLMERRDDLLRRSVEAVATAPSSAGVSPASSDKAGGDACATMRRREIFERYAAEVDAVLDRQCGAAWLREPRIALLVADALRRFAGTRYELPAWCVMPNHVHVVVRPLAPATLDEILQGWKSYTAHAANRVLGRTGKFWQPESFDHWIRDEAELQRCCRYTEENPVKAKLCARAEDWPWSSARVK